MVNLVLIWDKRKCCWYRNHPICISQISVVIRNRSMMGTISLYVMSDMFLLRKWVCCLEHNMQQNHLVGQEGHLEDVICTWATCLWYSGGHVSNSLDITASVMRHRIQTCFENIYGVAKVNTIVLCKALTMKAWIMQWYSFESNEERRWVSNAYISELVGQ